MFLVPRCLQKGNSHRLSAGGLCFCLFMFVCLFETVLCSHGCSETNSLDQTGLELRKISWPLPPRCWGKGCAPPHLALFIIF